MSEKSLSSQNRSQKNLRIGKDYQEWLEQEAQRRYGSSKKQGHVIEDLIDEAETLKMQEQIDEIHSVLVRNGEADSVCVDVDDDSENPSHSDEKSEIEEWEEEARNFGILELSDDQLRQVKSSKKQVDKTAIYVAAFKRREKIDGASKDAFLNFLRSFASWNKNEYSVWNSVVNQLHPVPNINWDEVRERRSIDADVPPTEILGKQVSGTGRYYFDRERAMEESIELLEALDEYASDYDQKAVVKVYKEQLDDLGYLDEVVETVEEVEEEEMRERVKNILEVEFDTVEEGVVDVVMTEPDSAEARDDLISEYSDEDEITVLMVSNLLD